MKNYSFDDDDDLRRELMELTQTIRVNPNNADAYKTRADVRSQLRDYQGAILDYTKAIKLDKNDSNVYMMRSYQLAIINDYKRAIKDCNKAINLNTNDEYKYNWRAEILYFLGEYKQAIEDSNQAIELNSHYAFAYYQRALIRNELGDYEGAINDYIQAFQLNSNEYWFYSDWGHCRTYYLLYIDLGDAFANSGNYKEAIENYNKVFDIECSPQKSDRVYNKRGNARYMMGDFEGSIEDYNRAIFYYPKQSVYYINRGNAYSDLKDYQKAVEDYNNAINIVKNDPSVYAYRGIARYYLDDKLGAIQDLEKAAALYIEGGWVEHHQRALNLIELFNTGDEDAINEFIYLSINGKVSNIPITTESSINSLLIESSLNNYTANVHKNDEQVFSEYTGCDNLVKIEEQEVIKANISLTQKNIKQAKEQINVNIARRQGQPQFRQSLLEAYNYRCAITEYDAQEALEAAHIIPYIETENNHPSNGLLLRADIHTLFDLNLIAINPETMQVQLAPNLLDTYYKEINGKFLRLPKVLAYLPKREALQWRLTQCEWYK